MFISLVNEEGYVSSRYDHKKREFHCKLCELLKFHKNYVGKGCPLKVVKMSFNVCTLQPFMVNKFVCARCCNTHLLGDANEVIQPQLDISIIDK